MRTYLTKGIDSAISLPHIYLMGFLTVYGPCTITEISNHLQITLSGVTSLVKKLVNLDMVSRERSEIDRRIVRISLTPIGEYIVEKVQQNQKDLFEHCFHNISQERTELFFEINKDIIENLLNIDNNV